MNSTAVSYDVVSIGLLVLRLVFAAIMFAHGAQKLFGWFGGYGLKGTGKYFTDVLRIPLPLFYVATFTEVLGSIAIAAGIFTQVAAAGFVILMTVAIVKSHAKNGFFMNWGAEGGRGEGYEYNLALLAIALFILIAGAGSFALVNE